MPRPCCQKTIDDLSKWEVFSPNGIPSQALQDAAARAMGISQQTFGRIIAYARHKIADALLNGKAMRITGGKVRLKKEGEKS